MARITRSGAPEVYDWALTRSPGDRRVAAASHSTVVDRRGINSGWGRSEDGLDELGHGVDPELPIGLGSVGLHRAGADAKAFADGPSS